MKHSFYMNKTVGRVQGIITSIEKGRERNVAMIETYGKENYLEGYKKHAERVMSEYMACKNIVDNGQPINKYSPRKIDGFEYSINATSTVAILRFRFIDTENKLSNSSTAVRKFIRKYVEPTGREAIIAQLNISEIKDMDLYLRYIYHVTQSFVKYAGSCV